MSAWRQRLARLARYYTSSPRLRISRYCDQARSAEAVRIGRHRALVGGLWDQVGPLQFDYVRARGLTPDMYVIDVGCGCLRGGVHFVGYLLPGHYYGVDISQELLDAGYDVELGRLGLQDRLPRENLLCSGEFELGRFGVTFDVAIAVSLFTHLPASHVRACLTRLAGVVRVGGVLYATIFLSPESHDWRKPLTHSPGGITTYPASDPYHYREEEILACAAGLPWSVALDRNWGHPRGQTMVTLSREQEAS